MDSRVLGSYTAFPRIEPTASVITVHGPNPEADDPSARSVSMDQPTPDANKEKGSSRRRFFSRGFARIRRAYTDDSNKHEIRPQIDQPSSTASKNKNEEGKKPTRSLTAFPLRRRGM